MKPKRAEIITADVIFMAFLLGAIFFYLILFHKENKDNQEKILRRLSVVTTLDSLEEQGGKPCREE